MVNMHGIVLCHDSFHVCSSSMRPMDPGALEDSESSAKAKAQDEADVGWWCVEASDATTSTTSTEGGCEAKDPASSTTAAAECCCKQWLRVGGDQQAGG